VALSIITTGNNETKQQSGTDYYYTRDHLKSVREMVNSSGTIVARYSYDPNGNATLVQGTNLATFQFGGYYQHQVSGLDLTWFRAYDPSTGRWLSRDPLKNAERLQGPNLYEYVGNDPVQYNDPDGRMIGGPALLVAGAIGLIEAYREHQIFQHIADNMQPCTCVYVQVFSSMVWAYATLRGDPTEGYARLCMDKDGNVTVKYVIIHVVPNA